MIRLLNLERAHARSKELQPMSLLRLRIKGRLYAGFGILVLFGVALAGFAVWQLSAVSRQVSKMTALSDNTIRVLQISTDLQAMRRATLRDAFDHDKASQQEARKIARSTQSSCCRLPPPPRFRRSAAAATRRLPRRSQACTRSAPSWSARSTRLPPPGRSSFRSATSSRPTSIRWSRPHAAARRRRPRPMSSATCCWSASPSGDSWRRARRPASRLSRPMPRRRRNRSRRSNPAS